MTRNPFSNTTGVLTSYIVIAIAFGAPAFQTYAQDRDIEEVIVTAQKREQNLQDVPLAVSVIGGASLDKDGNRVDLQSIQALVPSLTYRRGSGNRESTLIMRGIGTVSFSTAAEPAVATVIDGVVLSRSGQAFNELADIERVEVLKGPQGTLFGKNASGGVINVVTKGPTEDFEASAQLSYFEDDEIRLKSTISGPISDKLGVRLNGFAGSFDGHLDNIFTGEKAQGYDRSGVRAVMQYDHSDTFTATFIGDFMERDDNCCADVLSGPPSDALNELLQAGTGQGDETRELNQDQPAVNKGDAYGLQVNFEKEFANGLVLTSITSKRDWEDTLRFDLDFGPNSVPTGPLFVNSLGGFFGSNGIVDLGITDVDQFTQELRINSPAGERVEYTAGVYYFTSNLDRTFTRTVSTCIASTLDVDPVIGAAPCTVTDSTITTNFGTAFINVEVDNFAVFGNANIRINDKLDVILGARYTDDEVSYDHERITDFDPSGPGVAPAFALSDSVDETDFSVRAGVQYDLNDDMTSYFTYTQGYKGPAFNVFFNMGENNAPAIGAETADAFELGLKSVWLDGALTANLAAWYAEYENFQANSFININGVLTTNLTNAGTVKTQGVEADLFWSPIDDLSINASIVLTDAEVDDVNIPEGADQDQIDSLRSRIGTPLPFAPDLAFNVSAQYWVPLANQPFDLVFDTQYNYNDEVASTIFVTDLDNSVNRIDSYGIWNANISLVSKDDTYAFILHMRNIADESYVSTVSGGFDAGARLQIPRDADRYFGASARFSFQ